MNRESYQRVKSHAAAIAPRAFQLTDEFASRMRFASPGLSRLIGGSDLPRRRSRAHAWGWFLLNLNQLDNNGRELSRMSKAMGNAGVRPEELPTIRGALLAATRSVSGVEWTAQLESDWGAAFDAVAERVLRTPAMVHRLAA